MEWQPLKAQLDEQSLRNLITTYHFADSEYEDLVRCYRRLYPMVHAAVCYKTYDAKAKAEDSDQQEQKSAMH